MTAGLRIDDDGVVRTLTIDRPEVRDALTVPCAGAWPPPWPRRRRGRRRGRRRARRPGRGDHRSDRFVLRRRALTDTMVGDTKVSAGEKVVMWYWSANRDEAVFRGLPDLEVTGPPDRLQSNFLNGIKRMPCEFTVR